MTEPVATGHASRGPDQAPLVTVIVPVLGNCPSLPPTLELIRTALAGVCDYEVLVVADTVVSGPAVGDARLFALQRDWRVSVHEVSGQKAAAVRWGMQRARGTAVGYLDGDAGWEASPDDLRRIVSIITSGQAACACAERDCTHWPLLRRMKTALFARAATAILRLPVTDTQAPMKFFTRPAVSLLLEHGAWKGWEFDADLLWVLHSAGLPIKAVPVTWHSDGGETVWVTVLLLFAMAPGMVANLIILRMTAHRRARRLRRWQAALGADSP